MVNVAVVRVGSSSVRAGIDLFVPIDFIFRDAHGIEEKISPDLSDRPQGFNHPTCFNEAVSCYRTLASMTVRHSLWDNDIEWQQYDLLFKSRFTDRMTSRFPLL